jgi:hypothetical protein
MAITPDGVPAWVKSGDHTSYGGHINKINYQSQGAVNPRTDVTAEQLCRMAADLAAVMRTAPFAIMTYTHNDAAPAVPTVNEYVAMSGTAPSGVRNGHGDVTFTWSASYSDEYSVSGNIHFIGAIATVLSATSEFADVLLSDVDTNGLNEVARIRIFDDAGAAVQDAQVSVMLFTGPV